MAWAVEFAEEYALPGAEAQLAVFDDHLDAVSHEGCFHMGSGVALAMAISAMPGYHLVQDMDHVVYHIRVGIFVDRDAGCCVRCEYCDDALLYVQVPDMLLDGPRDIHKIRAMNCADIQFLHIFPFLLLYVLCEWAILVAGAVTGCEQKRDGRIRAIA